MVPGVGIAQTVLGGIGALANTALLAAMGNTQETIGEGRMIGGRGVPSREEIFEQTGEWIPSLPSQAEKDEIYGKGQGGGGLGGVVGETPQEPSALDRIQQGLDAAEFIPGAGIAADVANAGVSIYRGDLVGAGLKLLAAVPGIGDAAAAVKIAGSAPLIAFTDDALELAAKKFKQFKQAVFAEPHVVKGAAEAAEGTAKRIKLSNAQKRVLGDKLSKVADKTPRELLAGKGGLGRLQRVPGGADVDSTLADLAKRATTDDIARRTLKELKQLVPNLGL